RSFSNGRHHELDECLLIAGDEHRPHIAIRAEVRPNDIEAVLPRDARRFERLVRAPEMHSDDVTGAVDPPPKLLDLGRDMRLWPQVFPQQAGPLRDAQGRAEWRTQLRKVDNAFGIAHAA